VPRLSNRKTRHAPAIVGVCAVIFVASVAYSLFELQQSGNRLHPPVEFRTANEEHIRAVKQRFVGTYTSTQKTGDVAIVLHANQVFQFYVFTENSDSNKLELSLVDEAPFEFGVRQNQYIAVIDGKEAIYLNDGSGIAFHHVFLDRFPGSYIDFLPKSSS